MDLVSDKNNSYIITRFLILISAILIILIPAESYCTGMNEIELSVDNTTEFDQLGFRPKIALVLSGGGARGLAHIGAIRKLEEAGIKPDYIVATSMGAVIGGLYASGYSISEIDSTMRATDWDGILSVSAGSNRNRLFLDQKEMQDRSLVTLRFKNFEFIIPEAVSFGNKYIGVLQRMLWNSKYHCNDSFDSLRYIFRPVVTDLVSGKSISLEKGNMVRAIRASSTFPLRFPPVREKGMILVDGGILANLPVDHAKKFNPDIIIAVDVSSPLNKETAIDNPLTIADQVISLSMKIFSDSAAKHADILIKPDIGTISNLEFNKIDSLILMGEIATQSEFFDLKEIINKKTNSNFQDYVLATGLSEMIEKADTIVCRGLKDKDDKYFCSKFRKFSDNRQDAVKKLLLNFPRYRKVLLSYNKLNNSIHLEARQFHKVDSIIVNFENRSITKKIIELFDNQLKNKEFDPYRKKKLEESVLNLLRENDYSFASITEFYSDSIGGNIHLSLDAGRLKHIIIKGNEETPEFMVLRELLLKEGDIITADRLVESWYNLISTGLYSDVQFKVDCSNEITDKILIISVKERGSQMISIGASTDNERKLKFGLDLIQENLMNLGSRLSMRLVAGDRDQKVNLMLSIPRIFSTLFTSRISGYAERKEYYEYKTVTEIPTNDYRKEESGEFSEERYGFKAAAGTRIQKNGIFDIELRLEKQRFYNLAQRIVPEFYALSTIKVKTLFDSEDDSYFPREGRLLKISLESTIYRESSSSGFSKAEYYHANNYSFGDNTIRSSIFFGYADKTLPVPEFFSIGGIDDFFGFREDESRGRQKIRASLEYRRLMPFQLFFDTYMSLRYDIGSVWTNPESIQINDLKHGVGFKIAFDTPLGPASFATGKSFFFLKNPFAMGWGETKMYFSIGLKM